MTQKGSLATYRRPAFLEGKTIRLEPLEERHREPLRSAAAADTSIWLYFPLTFNGAGEDFDLWFDYTLERSSRDEHIPFAVRRLSDQRVIGTTRFYDLAPIHRRLAIGSTWYVHEAQGTLVNSEVRLLTLTYAFETLATNRVELITDPRNLASRAAMKLLGAVEEGVMRRHLIYKDGRVRDSVLFSILDDEWPAVRERLLDRLAQSAPTTAAEATASGVCSVT